MKKLLAALSCAAMIAIPTAANAADTSTGASIGGDYGHPLCYVSLDYFWVDAGISSRYPFVSVTYGGSVGGEVHCPLIAWG